MSRRVAQNTQKIRRNSYGIKKKNNGFSLYLENYYQTVFHPEGISADFLRILRNSAGNKPCLLFF
jgi:hypothetical protein